MTQHIIISAEVASHVLWRAGHTGGFPGSGFITGLLDLWTKADSVNAARLAAGFPEYAAAIAMARQPGGEGIEALKSIAKRPRSDA